MLIVEPPPVELDEYGATVLIEHDIPDGTVKDELHDVATDVPD